MPGFARVFKRTDARSARRVTGFPAPAGRSFKLLKSPSAKPHDSLTIRVRQEDPRPKGPNSGPPIGGPLDFGAFSVPAAARR
jgi:hypothetical protein